jgi:hypothetical protein
MVMTFERGGLESIAVSAALRVDVGSLIQEKIHNL